MTRTSELYPLQIAFVSPGPDLGRIGITFCPGKKQLLSETGGWSRNLAIDLDAVAATGAAVLLTLLEQHEIVSLDVVNLGAEVRARHMLWLHAPIRDVSTPDTLFEQAWIKLGEQLRSVLRSGFDVVVHCKGGLGRAGMVAARLMVELGTPAEAAISEVRRARPGAIETTPQEAHVRSCWPMPEPQPSTSAEAVRDRAVGALLGLAIGDAVGTTLEFAHRDSQPPLTDMVGGGPFRLQAGEWTDDTSMALALADSLLARGGLDEPDLLERFVRWREQGAYSCTGTCFDIGIATRQALDRWVATVNPHSGSTDPRSAGNGSLMRLAPVAVRYFTDRARLRDAAARQSRTTHGAAEAVDACVAFADTLADAIEGAARTAILRRRRGQWAGGIRPVMQGSWRGKGRHEISSSGYVVHSLEAALWSVGRTVDYRDAVLTAANLADDADTTAAITGQLAGALYGAEFLPLRWKQRLSWFDRIETVGNSLAAAARPLQAIS